MKKQLLSLCLPLVLAATSFSAGAATILGLDAGVYTWATSAKGDIGATDTAAMGIKDSDNTVTYLAFEHPIPIVPNVKLQISDMSATGSTGNAIDLSHTDSILYYEILDNIVSIDVGIASRAFDGSYTIGGATFAMDDNTIMAYSAAEVMIPVVGLSVGAELIKSAGIDDNDISDMKIRVRYEIFSGLGVEVGQRNVSMTLEESAPNTNKLKFDGTYFALTYTF